jgi:hypothetical protein
MPTYSTIADGSIDQDSPITQSLMTALRDNPLAIQTGDGTAPNIVSRALGLSIVTGSATHTGGNTSTICTMNTGVDANLADSNYALMCGVIDVTANSDTITARIFSNRVSAPANFVTFSFSGTGSQSFCFLYETGGSSQFVNLRFNTTLTGTGTAVGYGAIILLGR